MPLISSQHRKPERVNICKKNIFEMSSTENNSEVVRLDIGQFDSPKNANAEQTWRKYIVLFLPCVPLLFAVAVPVFCLAFYSYAAHHGHLEPFLQYVSDSGTYSPSAGYFAEALDIMAILVFVTSFARYQQQKYYIQVKIPELIGSTESKSALLHRLRKYNFIILLLAYVNVFSLITVANFRCNEAFLLHAIGAFSMFNCTFVSTILMIYISNQLFRFAIESRPVTMTAGLVCQLISLLSCFVFSTVAMFQFGYDNFFDEYKRTHWTSDLPGYWWHCLGTGFEWVLLNSTSIHFLCLFRRMRQFKEWHKTDL